MLEMFQWMSANNKKLETFEQKFQGKDNQSN